MQTPGPFRKSVAVVVGIDNYSSGIAALRTAVNDAQRLGEILRTQHGYEVVELLDRDATQANILDLLQHKLPKEQGITDQDRVLFYFAGHGVARDGDEGPNGYLLPVDAVHGQASTYLHMPLVHDTLLALECRHMLVLLDSCFSGAFRWSGTRDIEPEAEVVHQEKYDRFVHDPAWQVITSSSQDEKALDQLSTGALGSRDGDGAHSPFALALFEALGNAADAIPQDIGDGLVTATELYLYLEDRLQRAALAAGKKQTPRLWPLKKHDKGEYVFFVPGRELNLPPAPELTFENNPWRGLNSYEQTDAALFFGRDAEIGALQARIVANPMTVVLGGSGVGKSSLVKAGVLPKLSAEGWLVLPAMRPGTTPLIALAQSLGMMSDAPMRAAPTPDAIAAAMAKRIAEDPKRQVILVIDQFEEMITLVRAGRERDQMLALLARLVKAHVGTLHVVVTIRTDYEPNFDWSAFGEKWQDGRYVLPPMLARANLRAVIEKPAAVRVLYFDPSALIETLLDEIADNPGALPLLSFALSEMYIGYVKRKSGDRAIARVDYDAIGGVVGVLRSRAEAEYATLDSAQQATLKRVMLRLVTAEGGAIARRRAVEAEMQFADPKEQERAKVVIQRFTNARLLVEGQEPDGDKFVEPAHDALVRAWGRLLQWVREESEAAFSLAQQQRLARSAVEWDRADTEAKSGLLWSDASRSDQLAPLVRAKAPWFNVREMAFARRSVRGRRIAKMVTVGVAALIAVSGVVSAVQWRRAEAERVVAMEQREEAQKQRSEAMAQRAVAMDEKARALRSLFSSLSVSMARGNPGSLCIQPTCADAPPSDSGVWISLSRIPESLASLAGEEKSRDFIAAREDGRGHVLVYAHDGLTQDEEMAYGGDNMLFAENALRWLGTTNGSRPDVAQNCPGGPPLVLVWEGSFVPLRFMTRVSESVRARGWAIEAARPETFSARLRCAAVLWYLSDWRPPADFATTYVPQIKQFVRNGGGLLVGGLGWSYWQLTNLHPETPDGPYAADELGKAFGFSFTRDAFRAPEGEPVALLGAR